jgi:RNase P subunit RPR2
MNRKARFAFERKKIAKERIAILFSKIKTNPKSKYVPKYSKLIFSISKKYRIPKPKNLVKNTCSKCLRYLVIGKTARIRVKKGLRRRICLCSKSF